MFTVVGDARHEHLKMLRILGGELQEHRDPTCVFGVGEFNFKPDGK